MSNVRRVLVAFAILYASWLGMMAIHELGHVVHAIYSNGKVVDISIPLLGVSQTIVDPNPMEHFVVWGGPIWGATSAAIACLAVHLLGKRPPAVMRFFAGFCLIANGVYIGIGWLRRVGDAGDMLRLGTPHWVMIAFGVACVIGGLAMWHTLGRISGFLLPAHPPVASAPPSGRA